MAPLTIGDFPAAITVVYTDGASQTLNFSLSTAPYGYVYATAEGVTSPIAGATVALFARNPDGSFSPWASAPLPNPQVTSEQGGFGWSVPPGTYSIKISKSGFNDFETNPFDFLAAGLINSQVELLAKPPSLTIDLQASLAANLVKVSQTLGKQAAYAGKVASRQVVKFVTNPEVQKVSEEVVAPTAVGVTIVNVTVATATTVGGAGQLLTYLRFLFTQPILILFRRQRRKWGVVYNSLTKKPVELATVRLIEARTKKLAQSRVTDRQGRYAFFPLPGRYLVEVTASQLKFPTSFFAALKEDGVFLDLYHGEEIEVTAKGAVLTTNIPLDPVGAEKPLGRIVLELTARKIQAAVGVSSVFLAGAVTLIKPSQVTVWLLLAQLLFYALTYRFIWPSKPKKWGLIYNNKNKMPLGRAVARIFDKEYNKLLETQLTDHLGRYAFLVGRNDYYVIYEKPGFERKQSEIISLKNIKELVDIVAPNVGLEPARQTVIPPPPPANMAQPP